MEQRIKSLEEEVKLLKNQIRAVLLDIKENLASGDWQAQPGNNKAADPSEDSDQQPKEENHIESALNSRATLETKSIPASRLSQAGCDGEQNPPSYHTQARPPETHQVEQHQSAGNGQSSGGGLEPLTLIMLLQWQEKTQSSLGKEQTRALRELYCNNRDLPEQAKRTLQLVTALYGRDKDSNPDMTTIPYLLELDQLLNNREQNCLMQTTILKLLSTSGKQTPSQILRNRAKTG
jgi:hypothetical protein